MDALDRASLSPDERALLERYAEDLSAELGDALHAIWLFGSRARGETPSEDSDVDLLVLVDDASWEAKQGIRNLLHAAATDLGLDGLSWSFSVHVQTPEWLAQRRAIRSFFIGDVDRDKVVLAGSP